MNAFRIPLKSRFFSLSDETLNQCLVFVRPNCWWDIILSSPTHSEFLFLLMMLILAPECTFQQPLVVFDYPFGGLSTATSTIGQEHWQLLSITDDVFHNGL